MSRYREVGMLAEGGMAIVALGERDDGCTVVIKRVRPPFCFDASFLRLFHDEGEVHAALEDPHIVKLLDRGEDEAGPYLVFEHVDGTDLGVVMEQGPVAVECALAVAIPMMRALQAAHDAKDAEGRPLAVVHRDVSPGNVLIGEDGCVKLADFGVASFALKSEATVAGEMKGKFAYMAPEQTRGEKVGPAADIFSAGVVLWEALSGRRLFDGPTDADVVAAVRTAQVPALEGVPPALSALVSSMLAKDPAARPGSAAEVAERLGDVALDLGLEEGLSRHAARLARTAPRRTVQVREVDARRRTQRVVDGRAAAGLVVRRRSPGRVPALAAAGAVVVVAVVALAMRGRDDVVVTQLPPSPAAPTGAATKGAVAASRGAPLTTGAVAASRGAPLTMGAVAASSAPVTTMGAVAASSGAPVTTMGAVAASGAAPSTRPRRAEGARGPAASPQPGAGSRADRSEPGAVAASSGAPSTLPRRAEGARGPGAPPQPGTASRAAVAGFGRLTVTAEPWASVTIDGKLAARETPLRSFTLPAGRHTVVLTNPTYGTKTVEIDVPVDGDVHKFVDITAP